MPKVLLIYKIREGGVIGGVEYYRMTKPAEVFSRIYPDWDFHAVNGLSEGETITGKDINGNPVIIDDDWFRQFDLLHFCRGIAPYLSLDKVVKRLDRIGVPYGMDLDDHWELPKKHILMKHYKEKQETESIHYAMIHSRFVTCTTPILAEHISKVNSNVHVIENGIDSQDEAWQYSGIGNGAMRFGFMQGTTHLEDLKSVVNSVRKAFTDHELTNRFVIKLAGFGGQKGEFSIPLLYEAMITKEYNLLRPYYDYIKYLKTCKSDLDEYYSSMPYQRIWATWIQDWGKAYDKIDVSLIPLVESTFNSCKSELKLIEAGFKGKAAIVDNVPPYTLLATRENSFLIDHSTTFSLKMKYCINNPNAVQDKANQLMQDVKVKYDLVTLTQKRKQVYEYYIKKA